ncbi:MAG: CBASS cGAMP synthase [Hyphomonadaceae bacterium]
MGTSASLFYSTDSNAQTLHRRIKPSDEQCESQQAEWNNLRDYLVAGLKEELGLAIDSWLQGSYKFGTQIRPSKMGEEFDIDLGIYAIWSGKPKDGTLGPHDLKQCVQSLLEAYADDDEEERCEVVSPKERCNRIRIGDDFHIDTPCYHLDRGADARHLATESNNWEESDPKAIYVWWKEAFAEELRPRARRIVQYFKMWAALAFEDGERPSSVMLTVLVGVALQEIDGEHLTGDDEWFAEVVNHLNMQSDLYHVENPVDETENLNRLSDAQTKAIEDALDELDALCARALGSDNKLAAAEVWSEAFQHFFPIPDEDVVLKEGAGALVAFSFKPVVSVRAQPKKKSGMVFKGVNEIGPIPRDCNITFTLENAHELPPGARVRWTVRNEGAEAEGLNDLGHLAGEGVTANEHSAYKGKHFMDVSVWRFGLLIGRCRIPVTISGATMPVRNPARPNWTQFRSKRRRR